MARRGGNAAAVDRAWMFTFADLLALMLTFFVLLFSMSAVKKDQWLALVEALSDRLQPIKTVSEPAMAQKLKAERVMQPDAVDLAYLAKVLQEKMAGNAALEQAAMLELEDRIVVSLPGDFLFPSGSERLRPDSAATVVALADALRVVGNRIDVVGHTDPNPLSENARFASNWELSLARAVSVANALNDAGYPYMLAAHGRADGRFEDLSSWLPEVDRRRLARRVDLVIRESRADRLAYVR
jgi:chemotaxis protein MotB